MKENIPSWRRNRAKKMPRIMVYLTNESLDLTGRSNNTSLPPPLDRGGSLF